MGKGKFYNLSQIEEIIDEHIDLITVDELAFKEAEERATKFLVVTAILNDFILYTSMDLAKANTIVSATYYQAFKNTTGTVSDREAQAEADADYTKAVEQRSQLDEIIKWARTHYKIFNDAHITYRQFSKGAMNNG